MTLTLNLTEGEERRLAEKAKDAGVDTRKYIEAVVRVAALRPPLEELLRPVRQAFIDSGMTDDELGDMLERAKHEMRGDPRYVNKP